MPEQRTIDADDDGIRLDRWFKRHYPQVTHVLLQKLLRNIIPDDATFDQILHFRR